MLKTLYSMFIQSFLCAFFSSSSSCSILMQLMYLLLSFYRGFLMASLFFFCLKSHLTHTGYERAFTCRRYVLSSVSLSHVVKCIKYREILLWKMLLNVVCQINVIVFVLSVLLLFFAIENSWTIFECYIIIWISVLPMFEGIQICECVYCVCYSRSDRPKELIRCTVVSF